MGADQNHPAGCCAGAGLHARPRSHPPGSEGGERVLEPHLSKRQGVLCKGRIKSASQRASDSQQSFRTAAIRCDSNICALWCLQIGDFGLSRQLQQGQEGCDVERPGTIMIAAPELLDHKQASPKSDVHAFGILAWMLVTGRVPYSRMDIEDVIEFIVEGVRPSIDASWPGWLKTLMKDCWAADPSLRPSASELVPRLERASKEVPAACTPRCPTRGPPPGFQTRRPTPPGRNHHICMFHGKNFLASIATIRLEVWKFSLDTTPAPRTCLNRTGIFQDCSSLHLRIRAAWVSHLTHSISSGFGPRCPEKPQATKNHPSGSIRAVIPNRPPGFD